MLKFFVHLDPCGYIKIEPTIIRTAPINNSNVLNSLLHKLFLDHDIVFYFQTTLKKFKKNVSEVLNTFENIMENGAFAPNEQMLHFP